MLGVTLTFTGGAGAAVVADYMVTRRFTSQV